MRRALSLNHTEKHQNHYRNYSTCNVRYGKALTEADLFEDQLYNLFFATPDSTLQVIFLLTFFISLVGMVGNGRVIWLLGFCMKRNNFTIYVLNLAIADFGILIGGTTVTVVMAITILKVANVEIMHFLCWRFIVFTYCVGLYLLTAIGVERCLSILFPIWVRCHRPKNLSTIVSVLCWTISALFILTEFLCHYFCYLDSWVKVLRIMFGVNLFIFTPVMVVSTLLLFIKLSCRHQAGKLHTIILIILPFFIFTAVPYGIFFFLTIVDYNFHIIALPIYDVLVVTNSSINPIVYFFVGNQWKCRSWESMKVLFQRDFKDETEHAEFS